jgi:DNA-binding GntR family transcriptional regulator
MKAMAGNALAAAEIAERLEQAIVMGELGPGVRLIELDLAERYGVPRGRVREALKTIVAKGLALAVPARGVMVAAYSPSETRELLRVRYILELAAAEMAARVASAYDIGELRTLSKQFKEASRHPKLAELREANDRFHGFIVNLSGNSVLREMIDHLKLKTYCVRHVGWLNPATLKASAREHDLIVDALKRRDLPALRSLLEQHLIVSREPFLRYAFGPPA